MNSPEGFFPKNQNFTTQVARILWYRPLCVMLQTAGGGVPQGGPGGQQSPAGGGGHCVAIYLDHVQTNYNNTYLYYLYVSIYVSNLLSTYISTT